MSISKVARLTPAGRARILRGLARSWQPGGSHDARFHHATVDADTLRKRAFADRRGGVVMAGHLNAAHGALPFSLRWSTAGRTDQLDLFVDRRHVLTAAAPRILPELLALIA